VNNKGLSANDKITVSEDEACVIKFEIHNVGNVATKVQIHMYPVSPFPTATTFIN
jgi:hypothetical protein